MESEWIGEILVGLITLAVLIATVDKASWDTLCGRLAELGRGLLYMLERPQPCAVRVEVMTQRRHDSRRRR